MKTISDKTLETIIRTLDYYANKENYKEAPLGYNLVTPIENDHGRYAQVALDFLEEQGLYQPARVEAEVAEPVAVFDEAGFGEHNYPGCEDGANFYTSDCDYGCGCWMGNNRSGGPEGVDPFGKCPKNKVTGIDVPGL